MGLVEWQQIPASIQSEVLHTYSKLGCLNNDELRQLYGLMPILTLG